MLEIHEKLTQTQSAQHSLTLPFEQRCKSRFRAILDDNSEVGVFMPRGTVLRHGDCLRTSDGQIVQVRAASETVSTARTNDTLLLARAAYHLGNRHVALQLGAGWLRYQHDHVLDEMVQQLGLNIQIEQAPFEPEAGAYGGGHSHQH